jgi:hypothetical protein
MKFFRIDLLTLLISLFILNSCKNQDVNGFTLGTKGALSGSLVDTATIFTHTTTDDSVVTSGIAKCPVGYINDPIFGATEADLITDLNLPLSSAYTPPAGIITIDSAVLILKYADGFYGDSTSNYNVNVYQLSGARQSSGATYYSNTKWSSGTLLGTKTFMPRPLDSIKVDSIISGGPDTLETVSPEIRIPISKSFINASLFNAGTTTLNSNLIFKNNVKGLVIKATTSGLGGTMMFKGDSISMAVYIRAVSGTVIDTEQVVLPITQHASQITRTRSAVVQNAISLTAPTDSLIYLQGLAGTRAKVSFPYLLQMFTAKNNAANVIINRAELVVTQKPQVTSDIPQYLVPLPKISLYKLDVAHQRIELEDAVDATDANSVAQFGGYLLTTIKTPVVRSYHFLVTSYVQNLISNRTIDYGTYIAPVDTTNTTSVDIAGTPQTAARTVVGGGYSSAPGSKNNAYSMRLNIIYTKTK